jgi:hypothetical protein
VAARNVVMAIMPLMMYCGFSLFEYNLNAFWSLAAIKTYYFLQLGGDFLAIWMNDQTVNKQVTKKLFFQATFFILVMGTITLAIRLNNEIAQGKALFEQFNEKNKELVAEKLLQNEKETAD